ncbi:MAG: hypothetical protein J6M42_09585, partial [Clostridia bacterium]|nr:hypothetical protein [Clostridia bacterium]
AELVGTFPLGEGKGMRKPFFSLKPKEKHSFGDEGKLPFPRACLPLGEGGARRRRVTDEGHTKGFLSVQTVR